VHIAAARSGEPALGPLGRPPLLRRPFSVFEILRANGLLTLSRVHLDIRHERQRLISHKNRLPGALHAKHQARLDRWQKIITQAIGIGRNVGDAFLWFFYRNDPELLRQHRQQPPSSLPPTGDGGEGELALIDAVRFLGKRFILFHGITTLFRLGDASLLDLDTQKIVGIGELKTTRIDAKRLNLQFIASFSTDAVMPDAVPMSPDSRAKTMSAEKIMRPPKCLSGSRTWLSTAPTMPTYANGTCHSCDP
jgi:hypothetical protein